MALAIATNNAALRAAASASSVNRDMETSMARLSSGKRINSASDDAAGVAISSRLTSNIRGTDQAIRNALDGQALIDTAEGAHKEVENILQRMREVSVQAANDTNNDQDRANLQAEMNALIAEIDRIASTTTWAGEKLMEAEGGTDFSFQVGANTGEKNQIKVTFDGMGSTALGFDATAAVAAIAQVGGGQQDVTISAGTQTSVSGNVISVGSSIPAGFVINGIDAGDYSGNSVSGAGDVNGDGLADLIVGAYYADSNGNDRAGESSVVFGKADGGVVNLSDVAAGSSTYDASVVVGGQTLDFTLSTADNYSAAGTIATAINSNSALQSAGYTAAAATSAQVSAGTHSAGDVIVTTASTPITQAAVAAIPASDSISLGTSPNALNAITKIDAAIQTVNDQRSKLGAVSNRLTHTVNNLTNISANLSAARGGIEDADFALETTSLAKNQILQHASTAMLAQANASKQNVLSLLQG